jgi:splicing factor 3B subunit 2
MPEEDEPAGGLETPSGMATPSGMHSVTSTVPAGLETPAFAELRKNRRQDSEAPAPGPSVPRDLYQVIPERETTSKGFMGSSSAYDMSSVGAGVLGAEDLGKKVSYNLLFA